MNRLLLLCMLAACGSTPPVPPASPEPVATPAPPAKRFEPTSFGATITGAGRPIILIPGLACSGAVWDETVAHLAAHEVHTLTLSGFAGRPPIDAPLAATVRAELAAYIRDRTLDHPVVMGHSMGGFIALWLAATEPALVGPVIVVDGAPALGRDNSEQIARQLRDSWKKMNDLEFRAAAHGFFEAMMKDGKRLDFVLADVLKSDRRAIADALYELLTTDLRPEIGRITAPLVAVLADGPFAKQIREQLQPIPQLEVVVLAGTRHFVMFDDPSAFFRSIDAFLAAHPR